jgi:nucleotide-binding universal stress UspA family protein
VTHWFDHVYLPVVEIIRQQGILRSFPGRTETDLYLWIAEHRAELEEQLGWQIKTEYAVDHLAEKHGPQGASLFTRVGGRIIQVFMPQMLDSGPPVGWWRVQTLAGQPRDRLFTDLLVPVDGQEGGWFALQQALVLAGRENAQVRGLHIVSDASLVESDDALTLKAEFEGRCNAAGISGQMSFDAGEIARQISDRAAWADLVVVNLAHPPGPQPLARLSSGFRDLVQRCPRPILATPQTVSQLQRALVAYDGSPKAREALYIAAYLSGQWRIPLLVVSAGDSEATVEQTLADARSYLASRAVEAEYRLLSSPPAQAILEAADAYDCDFIIMGGYGLSPLWEVVWGSAVDQVLRESCKPVLICR